MALGSRGSSPACCCGCCCGCCCCCCRACGAALSIMRTQVHAGPSACRPKCMHGLSACGPKCMHGHLMGYHAPHQAQATPAHACTVQDLERGLLLLPVAVVVLGWGSGAGRSGRSRRPCAAALIRGLMCGGLCGCGGGALCQVYHSVGCILKCLPDAGMVHALEGVSSVAEAQAEQC